MAWKLSEDLYKITNDAGALTSQTWPIRQKLRDLGGLWSRENRLWVVPTRAVDLIGAHRVYGAIVEGYCHIPAGFRWIIKPEIDRGWSVYNFCNLCDSHTGTRPAIIDVCGEADVARAVYDAEFRAKIEG